MELRDYVRILHRSWVLIVVATLLGLLVAAGYSLLTAPKYQASTQLYVSVRTEGAATGDLVQGTTFARQVVASYVDIVNTALVLEPVIDELGIEGEGKIRAGFSPVLSWRRGSRHPLPSTPC